MKVAGTVVEVEVDVELGPEPGSWLLPLPVAAGLSLPGPLPAGLSPVGPASAGMHSAAELQSGGVPSPDPQPVVQPGPLSVGPQLVVQSDGGVSGGGSTPFHLALFKRPVWWAGAAALLDWLSSPCWFASEVCTNSEPSTAATPPWA